MGDPLEQNDNDDMLINLTQEVDKLGLIEGWGDDRNPNNNANDND
jgi:hypothetical protein